MGGAALRFARVVLAFLLGFSATIPVPSEAQTPGIVVGWGHQVLVEPSALNGISAISCGYEHTLVLRSDGTLAACGRNIYHQCECPVSATSFIAISAGEYHNLALKSDGSIVAWG